MPPLSKGVMSATSRWTPIPPPPSEPPPTIRHTTMQDVHPDEWLHDESMPVGTTWNEDAHPPHYEVVPDTSHLLWDTFMFLSEDLALHSVTPAIILTLLAEDDASRLSVPITPVSFPDQSSASRPTVAPTAPSPTTGICSTSHGTSKTI